MLLISSLPEWIYQFPKHVENTQLLHTLVEAIESLRTMELYYSKSESGMVRHEKCIIVPEFVHPASINVAM